MKLSKRMIRVNAEKMFAPEMCFYAFVAFFVIVFFTGGGSRDDIQSLLIVRPLAILFCGYALTVPLVEQWKGRMFPLFIVASLLVLAVFQLIPLPPSIWTAMPGRQIFADIADLAGIEQPWRPLSLSPSRTLNSLFSLTVPLAAMMLYLNLERRYRQSAMLVIIILCSISALWGVFQLIGPSRGPLYIYRITNFGTGVGLFANRNHQAVILACTIAMLGWYSASLKPNAKQAALKFYGSLATILVFVPLIFVTGSRAGLLLMVPALILALFLIYSGDYYTARPVRRKQSQNRKAGLFSSRRIILVSSIVAISGIIIASILLSRSLAFDRLLGGNDVEELRVQLLPTFFAMLKDYFPWGSGFGSFEHVYKIYEPQEYLTPNYLNQAHNDWLQFPIEGGLPAAVIAICAISWLAARLWTLANNWQEAGSAKYRALMCVAVALFLLAASIGDYPLRVPSIMAIFAVSICVFNDSIYSVQRRKMKQK